MSYRFLSMLPVMVVVGLALDGCGDAAPGFDFSGVIFDAGVDQHLAPTPVTLGPAQTLTSCLAVDATSLYWTDQGGVTSAPDAGASSNVLKLSIAGGTPTMIASGADAPGCVIVDGGFVYFTGAGNIYRVPVSGGGQMTVASGVHILPTRTPRIAVGGGFVYYVSDVYGPTDAYSGKNAVLRAPVAGGAVETVFMDLVGEPGGLSVSGTNLYYSDQLGMFVRPLAGGAAAAIGMSTLHGNRFAVDDKHVALAEVSGIGMGDVALLNLDGSMRTLLSMKLATSLAVDGSGVYGNLDGHLTQFALDGKKVTTLTETPPRAIALDSANVYFSDGASILKIAK